MSDRVLVLFRGAAGGHADGQRGSVGLPARAGRAAGGRRAARSPATRAARQLIDAQRSVVRPSHRPNRTTDIHERKLSFRLAK